MFATNDEQREHNKRMLLEIISRLLDTPDVNVSVSKDLSESQLQGLYNHGAMVSTFVTGHKVKITIEGLLPGE